MCDVVKWRFVFSVCYYVPSNDVTRCDVRYFMSISTHDRTNNYSIYMTNPLTTNKLTFPSSYGSRFVPLLMHGRQTLTWHNCTVICAHWYHLAISSYKQRIRLTCCTYVWVPSDFMHRHTFVVWKKHHCLSAHGRRPGICPRKIKKILILNYFK
jgi:hypothetical protein